MFGTIAIIGVGLIGGSLGMAIMSKRLAKQIIGIDRSQDVLRLAMKNGAIDYGEQDFSILGQADLVILATPVCTTIDLLPKVAQYVKCDAYVMDVGSTKKTVVDAMEDVLGGSCRWIGGHPMAGSEVVGVHGAYAEMFEGAPFILTPSLTTAPETVQTMKAFCIGIDTNVVIMTPEEHDLAVSVISHLPYLSAVTLVQLADQAEKKSAGTAELAAGGFRDSTRVAAGDPCMWRDILFSNRHNIAQGIQAMKEQLTAIQELLYSGQYEQIADLLQQVQSSRIAMNRFLKPKRNEG